MLKTPRKVNPSPSSTTTTAQASPRSLKGVSLQCRRLSTFRGWRPSWAASWRRRTSTGSGTRQSSAPASRPPATRSSRTLSRCAAPTPRSHLLLPYWLLVKAHFCQTTLLLLPLPKANHLPPLLPSLSPIQAAHLKPLDKSEKNFDVPRGCLWNRPFSSCEVEKEKLRREKGHHWIFFNLVVGF